VTLADMTPRRGASGAATLQWFAPDRFRTAESIR